MGLHSEVSPKEEPQTALACKIYDIVACTHQTLCLLSPLDVAGKQMLRDDSHGCEILTIPNAAAQYKAAPKTGTYACGNASPSPSRSAICIITGGITAQGKNNYSFYHRKRPGRLRIHSFKRQTLLKTTLLGRARGQPRAPNAISTLLGIC